MRSRHTVELTAGLFMLLGLAALLFLALEATDVGNYSAGKSYQIKARFTNIGDLKTRAPVAMAGVTIGDVKSINLDPVTYEAEVVMNIDAKYGALPTDTAAGIYTKGILGDKYIELDPGGSPDMLQDGDMLFITNSAVILEKLISKYLFNSEDDKDQE
ncbi:MAG: outer membrane lipid asymmetry maintenance protein MlaD [Gammaproteobacteria bacterium]|jgi:phospholipid/cholesterol/gamma-HCH transport system substrate-binding protein|nr:outer membrane lipid asymmetry maintenance protein MlaD [Gammaproteobacteria bacterium]